MLSKHKFKKLFKLTPALFFTAILITACTYNNQNTTSTSTKANSDSSSLKEENTALKNNENSSSNKQNPNKGNSSEEMLKTKETGKTAPKTMSEQKVEKSGMNDQAMNADHGQMNSDKSSSLKGGGYPQTGAQTPGQPEQEPNKEVKTSSAGSAPTSHPNPSTDMSTPSTTSSGGHEAHGNTSHTEDKQSESPEGGSNGVPSGSKG